MEVAPVVPIVSLSETQAYLRIETGQEEALLTGLIASVTSTCENFLDLTLLARAQGELAELGSDWTRLRAKPIRSIVRTDVINPDQGPAVEIESEIDLHGHAWLRRINGVEKIRVDVRVIVGLCETQSQVPEPVRQGALRLISHLYRSRDELGAEAIPAIVTALWRPYRRIQLV